METQSGFTKLSLVEFEEWIASISVARTITKIQEHHTWSPNYASFTGSNHFVLQKGMRDYHVGHNGWSDIGQHFSIFPDGAIVTGRSLNSSPACIYLNNSNSVCIENVGDFDTGKDAMLPAQRESIVSATAALARRFGLTPVDTNRIVYHHWYDLNTGERTNGTGVTKSCPGTAFFGGNSVEACRQNFLPLVQAAIGTIPPPAVVPKYGRVVTPSLNVRTGPAAANAVASGQDPLRVGAVVRIFGEQGGWLKIANSKEHWVSGRHVKSVTRREVNTNDSRVRAGPATTFPILSSLMRGDEVFVDLVKNGWARIDVGEMWIAASLLV